MTDRSSDADPASGGAGPASAGDSAGSLLRRAREAAGLHIGALSVALKVPVKKLEALESDQLDLLPDAVFARALASSVCRTLKIDPAPVLARLPEQVMPDLELDSRTTDRTNLHPPRAIWNASLLARIPRPVLGIAALLVVAALVLFVLPDSVFESSGSDATPTLPASAEPALAGAAAASTDAAAMAASAAPAGVANESALPATAPATPVSASVASGAGPAASAAAPAAMVVSASAPLGLRARSASWVEVTVAAGTVHLRKILNPGESAAVTGSLPLSVVVGRADAIEVQVRGQAFDLVPLARDNVARFQVK